LSCAQAHWVRSKPILRVMQLKLHEPTMAIGYSLRMCVRHVDSTNPGRSNLVFRSKPIPEAEMSNRLIGSCCQAQPAIIMNCSKRAISQHSCSYSTEYILLHAFA